MSDFGAVRLTDAGKTIKARCEAGETLVYKRVAFGDGIIATDAEADAKTGLVHEVGSGVIYELGFVAKGEASLKFAYSNSKQIDEFYLREIGIYVQDLDNAANEVLYAITYAPTQPDHIPAKASALIVKKWTLNIYIGNVTNVTAGFGNLEIIGVKVLKHFVAATDANGQSLITLPWNWNPQLDNLTLYIDGLLQLRSAGDWGPPAGEELSTSCNQVQFTAALSGVGSGVAFISLPLDAAQDISTLTNHVDHAEVYKESYITVNTNAVSFYKYYVDTSSSPISVLLPLSPAPFDKVAFIDAAKTFVINNLTVGRNGEKIQGRSEDMTVGVKGISFELTYIDSTKGWVLS